MRFFYAAGELREPLLQGLYHARVMGIRSQIGGHSHLHRSRREIPLRAEFVATVVVGAFSRRPGTRQPARHFQAGCEIKKRELQSFLLVASHNKRLCSAARARIFSTTGAHMLHRQSSAK